MMARPTLYPNAPMMGGENERVSYRPQDGHSITSSRWHYASTSTLNPIALGRKTLGEGKLSVVAPQSELCQAQGYAAFPFH
jgi:hypothetical protein